MEVLIAKGKKTGGRNFSKTNPPKNPGRKPLPKDLKEANELTKVKLQGMINKYLWLTQDGLTKAMKAKETPMIEKVIGSIIHKALVQGDDKRFNFILDRMIGKVKEEVDITTYVKSLEKLSEAEIITLGQNAVTYLKAVND